ncbi:MarR family winged helix-turn-helix transcriptional regulator [Malonomonas rubra]|uniref:MarR family winged helix-turn-helix transcriptional regulator n=1 Tax=Malonomonas rubra TaxID=57040 RepID=UPI0026F0D43F|nr:MarR family winged helix-turn-helix transcriptional regulator [Malonomonas rubra]
METLSEKNTGTSPEVPKGSYDLRIFQALRRIIRAVDIHSHKLSTQHKITGPQLTCLLTIKAEGPLTSANLAKKVYLSPSTVVGIIDRLEEKKLVSRNRDSKDRRLVYISITPEGQKLVVAAPSLLQDTLSNALAELPEIEQVSITLAMEKLVDLMEAGHIGAAPVLETGSLTPEK